MSSSDQLFENFEDAMHVLHGVKFKYAIPLLAAMVKNKVAVASIKKNYTKEVLLITLVVVALIGAVNWNGVSGAAVTTTEAATSPAWMVALIAGLAAVTLIMYFFKSE